MSTQTEQRLYYFTPPSHALENLQNKRLKVSRFSNCNDPFELAFFSQKNKEVRRQFRSWLNYMDTKYGLICFCKTWQNPVMWAHYAANHTGVCYGFDVDPALPIDVRYVSERLHPDTTPENFTNLIRKEQIEDFVATKFIHWSYEQEARVLVDLLDDKSTNQLVFEGFSDTFRLREVIIGFKSDIRASDVTAAVADGNIEVFKSRPAFQTFSIVRQKNKRKW